MATTMTTEKRPLEYKPASNQTIKQMMDSLGVKSDYENTREGMATFDRISLFDLKTSTSRMRGLLEFLSECEHLCDERKTVFIPYTSGGIRSVAKVFFTAAKGSVKIDTNYNTLDPSVYSAETCQFLTGFLPEEN